MDSATMLFSSVWDKAPHIVAEVYSHYIAFAKTGLGSLPGNLPTSLTELYLFWTAIPKLVLLIGHSIACVTMAPDVKTHFLLHFWLTYLGGSGGGLLSSVLMMDPVKAPISFLSSQQGWAVFTLVWWLWTYSPLATPLNFVYNRTPLKPLCLAAVAFNRAALLMSRLTLAQALFPHSVGGWVVLSTLAACGGKMISDAIRAAYGLSRQPAEFTVTGFSFRSAFLGSLWYLFSACLPATAFLTHQQAGAVLITLFTLTPLVAALTGTPCDWTAPLMAPILRLAGIPQPQGYPTLAPPTAPAKSKSKSKLPTPPPAPAPAPAVADSKPSPAGSGASKPTATPATTPSIATKLPQPPQQPRQRQQQKGAAAAPANPGKGGKGGQQEGKKGK